MDYAGGSIEEFDYDRVGNRVFHRDLAGQALVYTVDAADQLSAIDVEGGATQARFAYDAAGRLEQYQDGTGTTVLEAYGYDALGRLTTYVEPDSPYVMQLAYDAEGNRRLRSDTGGAQDHFFAGGLVRRGATRVRRIDLGGTDSVIAEIQETTTVSLFRDGTGNVTAAATGMALDYQRTFTAFGMERSASGSAPSDRAFSSLVREEPTGLLYARARHYDPRWGRFLQQDPLGIQADQLYAYAANNPYRFRDPLGLAPQSHSGGAFTVAGGDGVFIPLFIPGASQESLDALRHGESLGILAGGAAVVCVAGGCQAAAAAIGTATTRLGVELTIRGAATQAAITGVTVRASDFAREASIRGVVAAELALSRSPVLRGLTAGVKTAVFDTELPRAETRGERRAQQLGVLLGAFGDSLADLFD